MSVCVSDPAVPQELDTPGLTYLAYTPPKWQERALTNIFSTILEAIEKGKKSASFQSNEACVSHHWLS